MNSKDTIAQFLETAHESTSAINTRLTELARQKHHDRCIVSDVVYTSVGVSFEVLDDGLQNGRPLFVESMRLSNDEVTALFE
tara:strand:+ start:163205 stop:163450 length:246 start_codon:yes stop_codon:yes gene_type:complete